MKKKTVTETVSEEKKPKEEKAEKSAGKRRQALVLLFAGVLSLLAGSWLYTLTWGTRLLFLDATLGRLSRYYWLLWLLGAGLLAAGAVLRRRYPAVKKEKTGKKKKKDLPENTAVQQAKSEQKEVPDPANAAKLCVCSKCGEKVKEGSKFCSKCGNKLA